MKIVYVHGKRRISMAKGGPIVLLEDDEDDVDLFKQALLDNEIENKLVVFYNGPDAYDYLLTTKDQPFIIVCDVNLPKQTGVEFKQKLDANPILRQKSIPFVFYTTYVSQFAVNQAYETSSVQGFFQKNDSYTELKKIVRMMVEYWSFCRHPNNQ